MPFVRLSRAQRQYTCTNCGKTIPKRYPYYRIEPHPLARYHNGEEVKHICQSCAGGQLDAFGFVKNIESRLRQTGLNRRHTSEQLSLWDLLDEPIRAVETQVHVITITQDLIKQLIKSPSDVNDLTPHLFEELVCDRLQTMGFEITRVGSNTFRKDGGIDVVACNSHSPFPFFMAVQVKHHKSPDFKTGPETIRDLLGVLQYTGFNAGVVVTNTTFTPDVKWVAAQRPMLIRLKDIEDIKRWLVHNSLDNFNWQEVPDTIEVCPGVTVRIPR